MDEIKSDITDEGILHKGKFIEKNNKEDRVLEKRCKRCGTVLTLFEDDYGNFRLWCSTCDTQDTKFFG